MTHQWHHAGRPRARRLGGLGAILALGLTAVGCYQDVADGRLFACTSDGDCFAGWRCVPHGATQVCREGAAPADAAGGGDGPAPLADGEAPRPPEDMVAIEAGAFTMGSADGDGHPDERPQHAVTLKAFRIDRREVTYAEVADFLRDRGNACAAGGLTGDCIGCADAEVQIDCAGGFTVRSRCQATAGAADATAPCDDHPAGGVTWVGAAAYCAWRGRRLPTEAEWERAARGPGVAAGGKRRFPWGGECPTAWGGACTGASWTPESALASCGEADCGDGFLASAPAGALAGGASAEGVLDLAGNVWEWVEDPYHATYEDAPVDGSAWLAGALPSRVLRGGSWRSAGGGDALRAAFRDDKTPKAVASDAGFRCAGDGP